MLRWRLKKCVEIACLGRLRRGRRRRRRQRQGWRRRSCNFRKIQRRKNRTSFDDEDNPRDKETHKSIHPPRKLGYKSHLNLICRIRSIFIPKLGRFRLLCLILVSLIHYHMIFFVACTMTHSFCRLVRPSVGRSVTLSFNLTF